MPFIEISNLYKAYGKSEDEKTRVIEGFSANVAQGEFVSIFGPNACGKTTLLNMIAGLTTPDSGAISIGGRQPAESKIGFVFQSYRESLFPWISNIDNIAFSLESFPGNTKEKQQHIRAFVQQMGIDSLPLDVYPYQCSAGQQQLVAIIRELIYEPDILLMDEPFVSLDFERRLSQQAFLKNMLAKTKTTVLFVSHEIDEAIFLCDRLFLLSNRPVSTYSEFKINLPKQRTFDVIASEEFFQIKAPIIKEFRTLVGL